MKHSVVLLLGSNIDKERNIPVAIRLLAKAATVVAISPVYESTSIGSPGQPSFFNVAVLIHTDESAAELKDGLVSDIERRLRRVRTADKNAPRTIDLDIVLYDDDVFDYTPDDGRPRHVPDPDLLRYAHCALPVADLLPEMVHPETGETLRTIAEQLTAKDDSDNRTETRRLDFDPRSLLPHV
jgi:2-amino-4-hydroxy-6-hydroxymethyldihydropteridine diphosphokinase